MPKVTSFMKSNLKYSVALLAIILLVGQLYLIIIEKEEVAKSIIAGTLDEEEGKSHCDNSEHYYKIVQMMVKCGLAFMAGGLLSEKKFIKFCVF